MVNARISLMQHHSLPVVRRVIPHDIDFSNQGNKSNDHGDGNDGKVDARKLEATDTDVLPPKNVAPKHASKRCAERQAECPVVNTNG
jgi:hypothetical protein